MAQFSRSRRARGGILRFIGSLSWKTLLLLLILFILVTLALPAYRFGSRLGGHVFPSVTDFFYKYSAPAVPTPTAPPPFPAALPLVGSILYTVQEADSCDEILMVQMRMIDAGEIFTDLKPNTIQALNTVVGQKCQVLQPGMVLPLSPQYPLVAFGGVVLKVDPLSAQEVIPTPLIPVPTQDQTAIDCSGGCILTVRIAPDVTVRLIVTTSVPLHLGNWIWTQAMMARRSIPGFPNYPYADPNASFDGMTLHACDFQVETTHDANSLPCDALTPNTIVPDGGSWLFGVAGPSGLGHWRYPLKLRSGTRVLMWLSNVQGNLKFEPGNPVYRYDEVNHVYVRA
jgi:hypothetical protein